jgi:hypothetical protein
MSRIKEISKSKIGTYLQRVPAASASAGNAMSANSPRKARDKGVKDFLKRVRGTNMSVDKMTGKAKVPATESFVIPEDIPFKEIFDSFVSGFSRAICRHCITSTS